MQEALQGTTVAADFRYRYESVDEDGFDSRGRASLLRSRVTFTSGETAGFSAQLEIDSVNSIGVEDYNSTENGKTGYPTIADPEGIAANQAWLKFSNDEFEATLGRQRILLGNKRFIGAKPWRQNEQTYDGLRAQWKARQGLTVDASYVNRVNRIFGPDDGGNPADWKGDNLFLRTDYEMPGAGRISAFAYRVDVDPQSGFSSAKTVNNSSDSLGVEYRATAGKAEFRAAFATQRDSGRSELDYRARYYVLETGFPVADLMIKAAHEVLGADNGVGFATPLANGHGYQGWADKFLSTPYDGLKDTWVSVDGALGPIALTARYHNFRAESSSVDFGDEIDAQAQWAISERLTATLKAARFSTGNQDRYPDSTKVWLMMQLKI